MRARRLIAAVTAPALLTAASAPAADPPCVPRAEAEALAVVLLPDILTAVGAHCARALPPTATLRAGLDPIVARWRNEGAAAAPGAAAAVGRLAGDKISQREAVKALLATRDELIGRLVKKIEPRSCALAERALTLLAPLPARNIAGLFVLAAAEGGRGARGFPICPDEAP